MLLSHNAIKISSWSRICRGMKSGYLLDNIPLKFYIYFSSSRNPSWGVLHLKSFQCMFDIICSMCMSPIFQMTGIRLNWQTAEPLRCQMCTETKENITESVPQTVRWHRINMLTINCITVYYNIDFLCPIPNRNNMTTRQTNKTNLNRHSPKLDLLFILFL